MLRNFINYIVSVITVYLLISNLPALRDVFTAFSVICFGLKLSQWMMTVTRKFILYKTICPKDKAILVTGCDSGFGHELAVRLDHLGYRVYACCLDPNGEGAKKLSDESSNKLTVLSMNVTDEKNIQEVKEFVAKDLGTSILWAVVNNAGIAQWGQVDWTSVEDIQRVYDVNTNGTLRVTKVFLPFLKKAKGRIINIASLSGRFHVPTFGGYCISKSAMIALTTVLRIELAKWGVKAISIEPSFYSTPLVTIEASYKSVDRTWKNVPEEIRKEYGDEYVQSFKKYVRNYLKFCCNPNRSEVIDCLEDAITAEEPMSTYSPCSLWQKIPVALLQCLPSAVHENIQIMFLDWRTKPSALLSQKKEK